MLCLLPGKKTCLFLPCSFSLSLCFIIAVCTYLAVNCSLSLSLSLWFILQPITMVYPAAYHCGLSCSLSLWFMLQPITVVYPAAYHCGLSLLCAHFWQWAAAYHYGLSCSPSLWFIIAMCMYLTVSCSPGREDQNGTCRECFVGFYKNRTGAVECHVCPQGFRTPTNGSTDPADCSVGELVLGMHHSYCIVSAFLFIETRSELSFCELVHDQMCFFAWKACKFWMINPDLWSLVLVLVAVHFW